MTKMIVTADPSLSKLRRAGQVERTKSSSGIEHDVFKLVQS